MIGAATLLAAIGAALVGGIFFAFSNFVMPALGRLPPEQGAAAMQSINVTVLNPLFFVVFFGTAVLTVVLAGAGLLGAATGGQWLVAGALLYLVGCIAVTIAGNVPLNEALAALPAEAATADLWPHYLQRWTMWNSLRTVASLLAAAAFALALR